MILITNIKSGVNIFQIKNLHKKTRYCEFFYWWRGGDLNFRPSGYEPDELPDCSTPRYINSIHPYWKFTHI